MSKVIIITGASRGIGKVTANHLSQLGHRVYGTMRTPQEIGDGIEVKRLDVTDSTSIAACVSEVLDAEGRIDALINNAGFGLFSPVELVSDEEMQAQFDVNVFGLVRVCQAVIPAMREQKSGRIVNISSIAGIVSNPSVGIYSATKHAVEAISGSLAVSLAPWNIQVCSVEPGATATEFADSMMIGKRASEPNPYSSMSSTHLQNLKEALEAGQPVEEVAKVIAEATLSEKPALRYPTSERVLGIMEQFLIEPSGRQAIEDQISNYRSMWEGSSKTV